MKRKKEWKSQLPWLLDQLSICLAAGIEFREGLELVTEELEKNPLKTALEATILELRQGRPREKALRELTKRLPDKGIEQLADLVELSGETGSSLLPGVRALAKAIRLKTLEDAERKAIKAPFWLLLPLLFAIFPATGLILFTPFIRALTEVW